MPILLRLPDLRLLTTAIVATLFFISGGAALPCRADVKWEPPAAVASVATLTVEGSSGSRNVPDNFQTVPALAPWSKWIGQSGSAVAAAAAAAGFAPDGLEDTIDARASCSAHSVGILVHNSGQEARVVCINAALPQGLWRAEAALITVNAEGSETTSAKLWRMESVLRPAPGKTARTLTIPAGRYLALRWCETGSEADTALDAARSAVLASSNGVMKKRVLSALGSVEDALGVLPVLVGAGDREKIGRKIHAALLATGKAQALYQNWREAEHGDGGDAAFDELTLRLSEVSCAAFNLVPNQSILVDENGKAAVTLTVTNAGKKTVPLVALGISEAKNGEAAGSRSSSGLSVFSSLKPGASVTAKFQVPNALLAKGIVQFISRMGAAVIAACPAAP